MRSALGNQMFQYVAARLAAQRLQSQFVISLGTFAWRDVPHGRPTTPIFSVFPNLHVGLGARCVNLSERYLPQWSERLERRIFANEFRPWSPSLAPWEGLEAYDPGYLQVPRFTRLVGYFQSALYMRGFEASVRQWFASTAIQSAEIRRRWSEIGIDPAEAVAVHVRLSDYRRQTPIGQSAEGGWVLPREYYQRAFDAIGRQRKIVVFSDEPDLAEQYLGRQADHVSRSGDMGIDFRMMSSCARMIIANSTFSWWAAWLNPSVSREILAPECFLGRNVGIWYPRDIKVEGWRYL
jgi:hypothetical protein